jgi:hypothetical protein
MPSSFFKALANRVLSFARPSALRDWSPEADPTLSTASSLQQRKLVAHMRALQVRSLLDNLNSSLLASIAVALIATWALWSHVSHSRLLAWCAAVATAVAMRLLHRRYVLRHFAEDEIWLRKHLDWIRVGSLCSGLLWGVIGAAFFQTIILRLKG